MSELAQMLEQTATRLFGDHSTPEVVAEAEAGVWPAELWQALEATGLTTMLVPEEVGGGGGNFSDAGIIIRLAGRYAAPVPLPETLLASALLARAGIEVPSGPLTLAPVRPANQIAFRRTPSGWRLSGTVERVPWARKAGIVAIGYSGEDCLVGLVSPGDDAITLDTNLAGEPRDTITFDSIEVSDDRVAPLPAGVDPGWVYAHGALARALQMTGGLEQVLDLGIEYAGQRTQFGQPIGRFQVIQHMLVELAEHVAAARTATDLAARLVDRPDALFAIAAAKVRVSAAVGQSAAIAHQIHGAIGFTQEHRLQLSTRRLWSWRDEFGSEHDWATRLGRMTLEAGPDAFWPRLTGLDQSANH